MGLESARKKILTARILPMDRPGNVLDWMAFQAGRISAGGVGPVPPGLLAGAERIDLPGRTILPALHDCHVHFLETGLMEIDVDLSVASTYEEVLDLVASAARTFRGELLRAHSFDPDLLPDGRFPTAAELDAISTDLPILIKRRDGHSAVVNTKAFGALSIDPDVPGVDMDSSGRPTGILREKAYEQASRAAKRALSHAERVECFRLAARQAARRGIGVVHALTGSDDPENRDVEILLEVAGGLPVDVVIWPQLEDIDRVVALGLPRIGGCLLLDGSFSSGTAALVEPYADREGDGRLYYTDDFLTGFYRAAHSRGLQVAVHALGGRAIAQALSSVEVAVGPAALDSRFRIEHCELPSPSQTATMRRLGMGACVQPTFEFLWGGPGGMYERRLGEARAARSNPFRTLLDAGVPLAGGSDSYVTPMDSLLGIHSAVNRPNEAEQISVFEAVSLFTSGAAWFSFDEGLRGTLEVGKEASFTVLAADPFGVDASTIREIGVEGLFLRGESVAGG